jgi:nitroreductase
MSEGASSAASIAARFQRSQQPSDDLWEVLYTTRAIRRMKPDPVPDAVIYRLLDAAIRAPSGGNQQGWRFMVVRDQQIKTRLGELYRESIEALFASGYGQAPPGVTPTPAQVEAAEKIRKSAQYLAVHFAEVPVYMLGCIRAAANAGITAGASIYPAVWSLQLAARALGLGSTLTTVHRMRETQVKALLGVPDGFETAALIPIGYPRGTFAPGPRQPVEAVSFLDRWDNAFPPPEG